MNAPPNKAERPCMTDNTTYESYDRCLELNDYSNSEPCVYASVDQMTSSSTYNMLSGHKTTTFSHQNPSDFYGGKNKSEFSGQEMATFPHRDPPVFYGQHRAEFSGQKRETFSGQKMSSSDTKLFCCCVVFGVGVVILLLASVACASVALWMSSASRTDIAELQAAQGNTIMGLEESNPAASCFIIHLLNPFLPSDYYWIRSSNGSAVRVYCDMTGSCGGLTGGWRRIANLDFSNLSISCPAGLVERGDSGIRTCGIAAVFPTCASVMLPSDGIFYKHVCGSVTAYQFGLTDAFSDYGRGRDLTIDSNYVDGVSLTYGRRPRKHIWTFAAAVDDIPTYPDSSCQCMAPNLESIPPAPSFIGQDYFCATGKHFGDSFSRFYASDPLWDGFGCAVNSTCCSFNNPPWFYKQLFSPTTEDIEMRVCRDEPKEFEDIALSQVDIYVHN